MAVKYYCPECKTQIEILFKGTCIPSCCGKQMQEMPVKTEDAVKEKHVPYITRNGDEVTVVVGKETAHPMTPEHYINTIEICADGTLMRKYLKPGDEPKAVFKTDAKNIVAWELCNLHGLWKSSE